jgi:hypothetical protein
VPSDFDRRSTSSAPASHRSTRATLRRSAQTRRAGSPSASRSGSSASTHAWSVAPPHGPLSLTRADVPALTRRRVVDRRAVTTTILMAFGG